MLGEELGTERLVFLFWDKNFEKADDNKKVEYTKEIAGLLKINYDDLCEGKSEGSEPFPVEDNDIQSAIKTLGKKYNLNILAMRWQTSEYVEDSDGCDSDAQEWWTFAYVNEKEVKSYISDVNNLELCEQTGWSPMVLDDYSGNGIVELLSIRMTDALECDDKTNDCIYGGVEELFISICGDTENWISADDADELDFEDEE